MQKINNELKEKIVNELEDLGHKISGEWFECEVFEDNKRVDDVCVDDGSLHITRNGVRFCLETDQMRFGDKMAERLEKRAVKLVDNLLK